MNEQIEKITRRIKELEEELENEFQKKREEFHFTIEVKRVHFAEKVSLQQRKFKIENSKSSGYATWQLPNRPISSLLRSSTQDSSPFLF